MSKEVLSRIADRIDRTADRMRFSGRIADAEVCSQAASRIRHGVSIEHAKAIETDLITGMLAAVRTRLSALSGSGEYDTITQSTGTSSGITGDNPDVFVSGDTPHGGAPPAENPTVDLHIDSLNSGLDSSLVAPVSGTGKQQDTTGTDFEGPSSSEPQTAHVPVDLQPPPPPVLRAPDGTERPFPGEPERPEEQHTEPSDETLKRSEGGGEEEAPEPPAEGG
jgi:hypothetical protein